MENFEEAEKNIERLKEIRRVNNLTQEELADILMVSRSSIALYEKGIRLLDISTLEILCKNFNLYFEELKEERNLELSIKKRHLKIFTTFSFVSICLAFVLCLSQVIFSYNKYGYNIYDDEQKVRNSKIIYIGNLNKIDEISNYNYFQLYNYHILKENLKIKKSSNKVLINKKRYYIVFINDMLNDIHIDKYNGDNYVGSYQFIQELPDYDPSLSYDKQEGKSGKIINYYIDLINKTK